MRYANTHSATHGAMQREILARCRAQGGQRVSSIEHHRVIINIHHRANLPLNKTSNEELRRTTHANRQEEINHRW